MSGGDEQKVIAIVAKYQLEMYIKSDKYCDWKKKLIIIFACCLFNLDNNQLIFVNELINQRIANENRFDVDILRGMDG